MVAALPKESPTLSAHTSSGPLIWSGCASGTPCSTQDIRRLNPKGSPSGLGARSSALEVRRIRLQLTPGLSVSRRCPGRGEVGSTPAINARAARRCSRACRKENRALCRQAPGSNQLEQLMWGVCTTGAAPVALSRFWLFAPQRKGRRIPPTPAALTTYPSNRIPTAAFGFSAWPHLSPPLPRQGRL